MVNNKIIAVENRGEFQQLFSYLSRAIDTEFLHDPNDIPIIAIKSKVGNSGKSLAAEVMMKTWMDDPGEYGPTDIPIDNKMFLEEYPIHAAQETVSIVTPVAGKKAKLAFNNDELWGAMDVRQELHAAFDVSATGGVFIVSHATDTALMYSQRNVLMLVDIGCPSKVGTDPFKRDIQVEILNEKLLHHPRFASYWKDPMQYRRGFPNIRYIPSILAPSV